MTSGDIHNFKKEKKRGMKDLKITPVKLSPVIPKEAAQHRRKVKSVEKKKSVIPTNLLFSVEKA
tara:strand:- start:143 stop:334 length:192 start_codon:yes stop_codon:yes gene_type:complete